MSDRIAFRLATDVPGRSVPLTVSPEATHNSRLVLNTVRWLAGVTGSPGADPRGLKRGR